ncbi:MAG: hypothetical protein ACT4NP_21170 [Pseudonocardiales bacterium]
MAMVRADRLTATERAMLFTVRARSLAKLGRVQDAANAVGMADEEWGRARREYDPVWMAYYDAAQHNGDTGQALWDLAIHGYFTTEARRRLATAVAGHGDGYARARAMSQTKLASLVMVTGDPCEAATIGAQALDAVDTIRSRRAADDLLDLSRFSRPHENVTEVFELRHRIGTAVVIV